SHFNYARLLAGRADWNQYPGIKDLSTAGWIKSGAVEDQCRALPGRGWWDCVDYYGVELVKEGIGVVQVNGHDTGIYELLLTICGFRFLIADFGPSDLNFCHRLLNAA